jgi:chaperonin GroES
MKVHPTQDRILVRRVDAEKTTSGGIIIPDTAKEKPMTGIVIAIGNGVKCDKTGHHLPVALKEGQKVLFTKWSGTEVKVGSEELLIMKESDVLAIIED